MTPHPTLPAKGTEVYAFKKVYDQHDRETIALLSIPADAERVMPRQMWDNVPEYKCRAEYADVIGFLDLDSNTRPATTVGTPYIYDSTSLRYRIGERATPDGYDADAGESCGQGINFFLTFDEAVSYY